MKEMGLTGTPIKWTFYMSNRLVLLAGQPTLPKRSWYLFLQEFQFPIKKEQNATSENSKYYIFFPGSFTFQVVNSDDMEITPGILFFGVTGSSVYNLRVI